MKTLLSLLCILWSAPAWADTMLSCADQTNLACSAGSSTLSGTWNFGSTTFTLPANAVSALSMIDNGIESGGGTGSKLGTTTGTLTSQDCVKFDASGNLVAAGAACGAGGVLWNAIGSPASNQSLAMAAQPTLWTWNATTGAGAELFTVLDSANNTGTGHLVNFHTNTSSTLNPFILTAGGTTNGVEMSTLGVLAKIGTGSIVADNLIFGSDAQYDLAMRGASAYGRLAKGSNNTVLITNGSGVVTWGAIGPGTLASVLTWNQSCTASPCTLSGTGPRAADTALVAYHGIVWRRVASCGGLNEYTLSGTTLTKCAAGQTVGAAPDNMLVTFEM